MTSGIKTVIYPVKDLDRAKALFGTLLGVKPVADTPYYVGYSVEDQQIGLDPNGHAQGMTGPVGFCHVDDIKISLEALLAAGAETRQEIKNVGGGRLIASVTDPDGNVIGLIQDA